LTGQAHVCVTQVVPAWRPAYGERGRPSAPGRLCEFSVRPVRRRWRSQSQSPDGCYRRSRRSTGAGQLPSAGRTSHFAPEKPFVKGRGPDCRRLPLAQRRQGCSLGTFDQHHPQVWRRQREPHEVLSVLGRKSMLKLWRSNAGQLRL